MTRAKEPEPPLTRGDVVRAWSVGTLALPLGFFVYGWGRAEFSESVGLTLTGIACGLVPVLIVASVLVGPAAAFGYAFQRLHAAAVAFACVAAVAASIVWAMRDPEYHWDSNPHFLLSFVAASVLVAAVFTRSSWHAVAHAGAVFVLLAGVGAAAAEAALLIDEARFAAEIERRGADRDYDRGRAWPYRHCGLVYIAGKGTHATD